MSDIYYYHHSPHVCTPTEDTPLIRMDCVFTFVVPREAPVVQEGLAARGTGVGAVTGMAAHVSHQPAGRGEGLAARGAGVGADAGMGPHVLNQVA